MGMIAGLVENDGYTPEQLAEQYNNGKKVGEAREAAYIDHFARTSKAVREQLLSENQALLDIAYGTHPFETLDAFPSQARAPIIIFFHGGYWQYNFHKDGMSFIVDGIGGDKASVVIPNYPLCDPNKGVTMSDLVASCRKVVPWVVQNAQKLNGDPHKIVVAGHSAGAHIAAMLMTGDWADELDVANPIRAGVGISGIYDLAPIQKTYLNDGLGLTDNEVVNNSPVDQIPTTDAHFFMFAGSREGAPQIEGHTPEFFRQMALLQASWEKYTDVHYGVVEGFDHFSLPLELANPSSPFSRIIDSIIKQV